MIHRGAFSLVELVISLSILLVGIVGSMRVFPVGLRASRRSELNSRATIMAQRTIESLKLTAWDELLEGETIAEQEDFSVTTRVTVPSVEPLIDPTRLKAIELIVQWQQDGRARDVMFMTYLRRES